MMGHLYLQALTPVFFTELLKPGSQPIACTYGNIHFNVSGMLGDIQLGEPLFCKSLLAGLLSCMPATLEIEVAFDLEACGVAFDGATPYLQHTASALKRGGRRQGARELAYE